MVEEGPYVDIILKGNGTYEEEYIKWNSFFKEIKKTKLFK